MTAADPQPAAATRSTSLGERFYAAVPMAGLQWRDVPPVTRSLYERAAVSFVASLTYAESEGVREALLSSLLVEAAKHACDLLAERTYGSHARSPGHNARLVLEAAIATAEAR